MVGSLLGVSIGRSLCYILVLVAVSHLILECALQIWSALRLRG